MRESNSIYFCRDKHYPSKNFILERIRLIVKIKYANDTGQLDAVG
jgi:hypothetical protein